MSVVKQTESDEFLESVRLLKELHLLSVSGDDESPEADTIREAMEDLWWRLSDVEQQRLQGLSADLYSIGGNRAQPVDVPDELAHAFEVATIAGDWDRALAVLRANEQRLPPCDVATMRGIAWAHFKRSDIAALFFGEAARVSPNDPRLERAFLRALIESHQFEEARDRAEEFVQAADRYHLLLAADVLFECAIAQDDEPDVGLLRRVGDLAELASQLPEAITVDETISRVECAGYLSAALSFELLGEHQHAVRSRSRAEQSYPPLLELPQHREQINDPHSENDFVSTIFDAKQHIDVPFPAPTL